MIARPIRSLTSLRGIAAWWVVFYHFKEALPDGTASTVRGVFSQGYLAVDLFFQLSGFVLALNYADRMSRNSLAQAKRFYALRFARVYPVHLFMLLLFLTNPIGLWLFSPQGLASTRWDPIYYILSLMLVQNWGFTTNLGWNVPAWSISTEWFSYLMFPLLVPIYKQISERASLLVLVLACLLIALAAVAKGIGAGLGDAITEFGLLRCVLEFQIGMCIYYLRARMPDSALTVSRSALALAFCCFLVYACSSLPNYSIIPLGFCSLVYGLSFSKSEVGKFLLLPGLEWLGSISYSTYMCQYFVKDWVKFLLVGRELPECIPLVAYIACTLMLSPLLYRFVERPGQRATREFLLQRRAANLH